MKKILVATDFSEAARNASEYSLELARTLHAGIVLFTAYQQMPVPVTETPVIITLEDMRKLAQQGLDAEAKIIDPDHRINIETYCKEGVPEKAILKAAKDTNADLIIAGMKRTGKSIRRILGSTTTALARKTSIPLIVVPEGLKYSRIATIALANESDLAPDEDSRLLDALLTLAEKFYSKLYLVRVAKDKFWEAYEVLNLPLRLSRMMRTLDPVYECIEGKDIPQALNEFIDAYHVTMLAMIPHKHSFLDKWFIKSTTRSMIFKSNVPLLILPDLPAATKSRKLTQKEEKIW
ncbi:MAG: universal stress protein [Bacteroidota bacterium]|nr:universal stress protein [Bacteroidota bacterium]